MTILFSFVGAVNSSAAATTAIKDQKPATLDSDFVVILAALLCALICVLGLIAVARCAWLRRFSSAVNFPGGAATGPQVISTANRGLKKKILKSLPKQTFSAHSAPKSLDCVICLAEFATGDEIRVLPQCGHGFHVNCIDTWLGTHSSCPSCRQIIVVARCQKCGGLPASSRGGAEGEVRMQENTSRFLP